VPNVRFLVAAAGVSPEVMAKQMEKAAADRLRKIAASLPQEISVTTLVRRGDPTEEILTAAREQRADVICLGAVGRGRVAGALLGSVSSAVLCRSPLPVVVWHPPREAEDAILPPA
jgi:universal stress protein A